MWTGLLIHPCGSSLLTTRQHNMFFVFHSQTKGRAPANKFAALICKCLLMLGTTLCCSRANPHSLSLSYPLFPSDSGIFAAGWLRLHGLFFVPTSQQCGQTNKLACRSCSDHPTMIPTKHEPVRPRNAHEPAQPRNAHEPVQPRNAHGPVQTRNPHEPAQPRNAHEPVQPHNAHEPVQPATVNKNPTDLECEEYFHPLLPSEKLSVRGKRGK
jgi:hypothetical protein